ncbi:MAG: hypothetical protein ACI4KF_13095 [Huintestinicola sp.]
MDNAAINDSIYKTASMGITSLKKIIPDVQNHELKDLLVKQYKGYCRQSDSVCRQMKAMNHQPTPPSKAAELMTKMGITMNLMKDKSTPAIAKMLVKGTNMGIIELSTAVNHAGDCSPETVKAAKDYLHREQVYIDSLKKFL